MAEVNDPCQTASLNTTVFDIPTLYYRVGQNEASVEQVIDVYVYDCSDQLKPFALTSDSSELSISDCGDDCKDLFADGVVLTYTPTAG